VIGLHWIDWAVIALYLAGISALGVWAGLRVKDAEDYLLANRRFRWWIMAGQAFGVGTHAEMPVGLAGKTYAIGFPAIWYQWKNLFATPFYWLIAPIFRRIRRTTTGELVEDRYGPRMAGAYTVFALAYFTINQGVMLKGAARIIASMTGGAVEEWHVIVAYAAIVLAYTAFGGLASAAMTDFAQSFLIIALSFILIPLGLARTGGLEGLHERLEPWRFGLLLPGDVGLWLILLLTLNGLVGIVAQPHILATTGTGRDEWSCRVGFTYGNFAKRICTVGWALAGLIAIAVIAPPLGPKETEKAFGLLARELLGPGLAGLLVASVLAANMSTSSAFMVSSGALFARNVWAKIFGAAEGRAELRIARLGGIGFALLGMGVALMVGNVLDGFLFVETIASYMGIAIFGGIIWPRASRRGAALSIAVALALHFALDAWWNGLSLSWDSRVFAVAFFGGWAALIAGSLLGPPEPAGRLADFFGRLETPSDGEGGSGKDLVLVRLADVWRPERRRGFLRRHRSDLAGFALAWLVVAALILGTWLVLRID
jgi:Na+/proline symporter